MPEQLIGEVTHYYSRIGVAALSLRAPLHSDDRIHLMGHTTDFEQTVESMEVNHQKVDAADTGDDVALHVVERVRGGDQVYRATEAAGASAAQGE